MSGFRLRAFLPLVLLVLLTVVPWAIINFTYAIPLGNYGWDYQTATLAITVSSALWLWRTAESFGVGFVSVLSNRHS